MKGSTDCIEQTGRIIKTGGIKREQGTTDCITRDDRDGI